MISDHRWLPDRPLIGKGEKPAMTSYSFLSRALLAGVVLSFVSAKGCLGGDVSLGYYGTSAGAAGSAAVAVTAAGGSSMGTSAGATSIDSSACEIPAILAPCTTFSIGYSFDPEQGKCLPFCGPNARFGSLEACQATCDASSSGATGPTEATLFVDSNGHVSSSVELGVSGPIYRISDSVGLDGTSNTGDCELAGHAVTECARVITPPYTASGAIDWSAAGLWRMVSVSVRQKGRRSSGRVTVMRQMRRLMNAASCLAIAQSNLLS